MSSTITRISRISSVTRQRRLTCKVVLEKRNGPRKGAVGPAGKPLAGLPAAYRHPLVAARKRSVARVSVAEASYRARAGLRASSSYPLESRRVGPPEVSCVVLDITPTASGGV